MDQNASITQAAAHLWIGHHDELIAHTTKQLQKMYCQHNGCDVCISCIQIKTQQHHAIMWLYPEKNYTKDQFDPLFNTLTFALQPEESFFFIIQKADFLTPATANRLLKSLEEPPPGYHFVLLAERLDQILPTIKSRCIVHEYRSTERVSHHELFEFFNTRKFHDPSVFLKQLDFSKISEHESIELLDSLVHHWSSQYKKALTSNDELAQKDAAHMIAVLKKGFERPPMPGSSSLFWKDLYLQMQA